MCRRSLCQSSGTRCELWSRLKKLYAGNKGVQLGQDLIFPITLENYACRLNGSHMKYDSARWSQRCIKCCVRVLILTWPERFILENLCLIPPPLPLEQLSHPKQIYFCPWICRERRTYICPRVDIYSQDGQGARGLEFTVVSLWSPYSAVLFYFIFPSTN